MNFKKVWSQDIFKKYKFHICVCNNSRICEKKWIFGIERFYWNSPASSTILLVQWLMHFERIMDGKHLYFFKIASLRYVIDLLILYYIVNIFFKNVFQIVKFEIYSFHKNVKTSKEKTYWKKEGFNEANWLLELFFWAIDFVFFFYKTLL